MVAVPQNAAADQGAILEACRADLAAWAAAQAPRGEVFVARDPIEPLLLLLGARSEGFRVVLSLGRDESADRENPALVINTTVQMVVQSGEGLRADRSILAWKGESGRPSLLRLVRDVRFRALCWKFNTSLVHRGRLFYDGAEPYVPPDGVPLAAYQLTFHFRAAGRAPLESDRVEITVPAEAG